MTTARWTRIGLGYLALVSLQLGLWAQFAPRSFYDDFPGLGRSWVSVDGPYNQHLVRDVGGLNLALAALLIVAIVTLSRPMVRTSCVAALLFGVPHLIYHVADTHGLATGDVVASIGGLALFAAVPVVVLVVTSVRPKSSTPR